MKHSLFSKNWLVHRIGERCITECSSYAGGLLLDVGCGEMPYRRHYSRRTASYVGLDLPGVGSAAGRPDVYGDALKLPFADRTFDTVVSFQVLEHVREPGIMIGEIVRVLVPGGHAIISAPHMWGLHEIPRDYYRFTEYGLRHLFESRGLEVLSVKPMAGYWVTAGTRFCCCLETLSHRSLKPLFGLTFFLVQSAAMVLDRIHRVDTDAWNYIAVGRKPC